MLGVVVLFLLIRGCGGDQEPETPHPTELGYPEAPEQQLPETTGQEAGDVPITELVEPEWVSETAQRTGVPQRAVAAYAGAAAYIEETDSECGIGWNTLAGIGQVESVHGHHGGSSIEADGEVSPEIIGVPLDGSEGVMEIPDTDGGELDGDEEWDRAVGPMQFIPETWYQYAQDGNLSGEADIHQYDDAALTAAVYLCASGDDLTDDRGWNDAVTTYNQSVEYANDVARHSEEYAEAAS
ncbi:lytic transglycosylase domain-containing protein [Nesterenkonia sedimenti]|uniref:lytic transglycosylase domain-containing protein n=1 Tax=Nesterenkonia sedimenti TaxID=1463632 RepID=UPI002D21B7EC|nr:lytic murein transglycosylase [Nesterenkonia sedimenti]